MFISKTYSLTKQERLVADKVYHQERINEEDALLLYQSDNLPYLASLANYIRMQRHGLKTYFNRNFHIEPTNICIYDCKFCSYSRTIKKREDGWEYTEQQMLDMVKSYNDQQVTEVHIVGGVLPQYDLEFYENLFRKIKAIRPGLHIKALTPVEFHYIFKKAKVSYEEGLMRLKAAGLDSIPGGGAEIFHPEIRNQIAKDKANAENWLELHKTAHNLGIPSNATMLYGHIEKYEHRVHHLQQLRILQDETKGFQAFIPLKFRNQNNEMSHLPEVSVIEDLKNYAVSRIYLDNFPHLKAYWAMIGRETAQIALDFGVNDIDGTIDDTTKIYSMAGAEEQNPKMTTQEIVHLIQSAGYQPIERDTLYQPLNDYSLLTSL